MKYNLALFKDIGRLLTATITYSILFVTVFFLLRRQFPTPYWLLGILVILIYNQLIQYYCYQPFVYIVLHGISFIPVLFIPFIYTEYRYLFLTMLIFENVRAIHIWKKNGTAAYKDIPWHLLISVCLIYIIACAYHLTDFAHLIYYLGICLILVHFIRIFINGLTNMLAKSHQATSIPAKKIILTTSFILMCFLLVLLLLFFSIPDSNMDEILVAFGKLLTRIGQLIFRLVIYIATIISALFSTESKLESTEEASQDLQQALTQLQEPSLLAQILDGIITITAIFFAGYCIYLFAALLIRIFSKHYTQDTDIVVQLSKPKDITKLPGNKISIIDKIRASFKNDNASKIRKGYQIKIKSFNPSIYKAHSTPAELATFAKQVHNENIDELTQVYEKARYSNEEITFQDVEKGGLL